MARQLALAALVAILFGGGVVTSIGCAGLVGADFGDYGQAAASTLPNEPAERSETVEDGGSSTPAKPDAAKPDTGTSTAKKCVGTPTTCLTYATDMTSCQAQDGCTWQATACKLTTPCSSFQTNQQCQNAAGCGTDFTTSTCKPIAGYCSGTTKAACESKSACAFSGGCAGQASACSGLAETTCKVQAGCSWQ